MREKTAIPTAVLRGSIIVAALMMGQAVAGKTARDALFLSQFGAKSLPMVVAGSAGFALICAFLSSRLMERLGPNRIVPLAFALSALLQVGEWWLLGIAPRLAAVIYYLHHVGFGTVLTSGYWSLLNEHFDPRSARQNFGQIAAAGTIGGLCANAASVAFVELTSGHTLILALSLLHLGSAAGLWATFRLRVPSAGSSPAGELPERIHLADAMRRTPYLAGLAALVALVSCCSALLDIVFKASAQSAVGTGDALFKFFGLYNTAVSLVAFLVQSLGTRALPDRSTVGRMIPALPAVVSLGSLAGVLAPVFGVLLPVRAAESVVRGSVFRSGYELLYIPVEAADKRAAKTVIDVGADRLGEAVGSGIYQFFIVLGSAAVSRWVLMMTAGVGLITLMVSRFIGSAYAEVLARSLERRAGELDLDVARDWANLSIVMESGVLPRPDLSLTPSGGLTLNNRPRGPMLADQAPGARRDPVLDTLAELRCGDPGRISRAVLDLDASDPLIAAQLVQLLAVDEVTRDVRAALAKVAPKIVGLLADNLLNPDANHVLRRRIPRILAAVPTDASCAALMKGLQDSRFGVRFQCGAALNSLKELNPELPMDPELVMAVVDRELSVGKLAWRGRQASETVRPEDFDSPLDEYLRKRTDRSLEHVFSLLSLIHPKGPLKIAFRALHTDDNTLRATALEFLDTVLPAHTRDLLFEIVEEGRPLGKPISRQEAIERLVESSPSVQIKLDELELETGRLRRPEEDSSRPDQPDSKAGPQ